MDPVAELFKQGIIGIVAGIFLWLYLAERKDHAQTRKEKDALMEARRLDAKETVDSVTQPLQTISQGIALLSEKIEIGKGRR